MKKIKKIFQYVFNFQSAKFVEIKEYYQRYTILPRLMGFKQSPSLEYRLGVLYEYFKYRHFNKSSDSNYILDCIPRTFFNYYLSHKTDHFTFGHECVDKGLFYQILDSKNLPIPKTYFLIKDGEIQDIYGNQKNEDVVDSSSVYFAKALSGSAGKGAVIIKKEDINKSKYEGFIFQEVSINHNEIKKLAPNKAFNTIRLHTYYSSDKEQLTILAAHIKLAGKDNISDNIGTGGIGVEINTKDGTLKKYGFSELTFEKFESYPGSNIKFENFVIPYWKDLLNLLEKASKTIKSRLVGWDVGITNQGVVFIEGNSGSDIFIPQAFYRPFYNTPLISEQLAVSEHHKWIEKYAKQYNCINL